MTKTEQLSASGNGLDKQEYQEIFGDVTHAMAKQERMAANKQADSAFAPAVFLTMVLTLTILLLISP